MSQGIVEVMGWILRERVLDQGSGDPKDLLEGQGQGVGDEEKGNLC